MSLHRSVPQFLHRWLVMAFPAGVVGRINNVLREVLPHVEEGLRELVWE